MFRIIKEVRPRWVIAENVAGHIGLGLDQVLSDLAGANYTAWPFVIPACALGASHRRSRVWIIAYDNGAVWDKPITNARRSSEAIAPDNGSERNAADSSSTGLQGSKETGDTGGEGQKCKQHPAGHVRGFGEISEIEPTIRGSANGIPYYSHRIRSLGNSVVPQIPELIGRMIMEVEND